MSFKYILLVPTIFFSSVSLAEKSDEKFELSCIASQSESEEDLRANAMITITRRPSTGAGLIFDYGLLNLPYEAKVEIDFGENLKEDRWTLYFTDRNNSEKFGWTKATIASRENEISIKSKTLDLSAELIFSCSIERLQ